MDGCSDYNNNTEHSVTLNAEPLNKVFVRNVSGVDAYRRLTAVFSGFTVEKENPNVERLSFGGVKTTSLFRVKQENVKFMG